MITTDYAITHRALVNLAREHQLVPHDVRVLLAVAELGGDARSDELEHAMLDEGTAVRRSLITLYNRGLADGWPRKRGTRTIVTLTETGVALATAVLATREQLAAGDETTERERIAA